MESYHTKTIADSDTASVVYGPRLPCRFCDKTFLNRRAIKMHCTMKHSGKDERAQRSMIRVSNQCPWCQYIFCGGNALWSHVQSRIDHGNCPKITKRSCNLLKVKKDLRCTRCHWKAADLNHLQAHFRDNFWSRRCEGDVSSTAEGEQ